MTLSFQTTILLENPLFSGYAGRFKLVIVEEDVHVLFLR